jgi:NitT/TauT family transport system substrate-binding protein
MDSHPRPDHRLQALSREALSRREFLRVAASAGAFGAGVVLLGACSDDGKGSPTSTPGIVVDPPPETTTIRIAKDALLARLAPLYLAQLFLPEEGFTDVQYIDVPISSGRGLQELAAGEIDIGLFFAQQLTVAADAGEPLVALAGVQSSDFVLFGNDRVQSLRDLKGKRIYIITTDTTDPAYIFWAALLAHVGIDIEHEVELVQGDLLKMALEGTIDAWTVNRANATVVFGANKIGHVVLDAMVDPPWSQYFGAMATGNRDFVEKHPAATKRALRAILKATDLCTREPERAARYLVDEGFTPFNYDVTLAGIPGLSYAAWRDFDPEDTMRFYALRLRDAGLIKSTPDELIARATDWHYLEEIKRELAV